MAHGGKRTGSGRKKGSKVITLQGLLKTQDINAFVKFLLKNYQKDTRLAVWMGDHLFGKAPQPIQGDPDNPLTVKIVDYGSDDTS